MRRTLRVLAALCSLSAVACTPTREVPEASLGFAVPSAWSSGELEASVQPSNWWADFGDVDLDLAIEEALENSLDLVAAEARIRSAQADARISGAPLLPQLELNLTRSQQRQNFIGFPIPGSEGGVLSTTSTNYGLRLNASWEPDVWSRVRSGEIATVTNTRIRHAELAGARLSLTGQVAHAWFAAVEARRQVDLAEESLDSYGFSAERVRARFEAGLRPSLDYRLALTEVATAAAVLQQRVEQRERVVRQLQTLMGRYPGGNYVPGAELPELPSGVPGGLPSELLHRRPDLASAEMQVIAADARLAEAEAGLKPRFNLTTGVGTSSDELVRLVNGQLFVWSLVGSLVQPVFEGGRLRAAVDRSQSAIDEALANYENRILAAYGEVESALAAEEVLARREDALEEAARQSVAAQEQAQERYRLGLADIVTVLASQRAAYNSESQLLTVKRSRLDNRVDLHVALGGGFDFSDLPSLEQARDSETGAAGAQGGEN